MECARDERRSALTLTIRLGGDFMTYATVGMILAACGLMVGAWCGFKQNNVLPAFSLLYMVITGSGYLLGYGAKILHALLVL